MLTGTTPTNPKPCTFIPSLEFIQILDGNMLENQIRGTIPPHWTENHKGYRVIHYTPLLSIISKTIENCLSDKCPVLLYCSNILPAKILSRRGRLEITCSSRAIASNCSSMKINTAFPSLVASLVTSFNMLPSIQGPEGMANGIKPYHFRCIRATKH